MGVFGGLVSEEKNMHPFRKSTRGSYSYTKAPDRPALSVEFGPHPRGSNDFVSCGFFC